MTITRKGWNQDLMLSLYTKEVTYDAGVTMNGTNACEMKGYTLERDWPDELVTDKEEVTGTEHGTDQELNNKAFQGTYVEPKAHPNALAGLGALVLGDITSTQDGSLTAYKHKL